MTLQKNQLLLQVLALTAHPCARDPGIVINYSHLKIRGPGDSTRGGDRDRGHREGGHVSVQASLQHAAARQGPHSSQMAGVCQKDPSQQQGKGLQSKST
jgi:hypothetical protein